MQDILLKYQPVEPTTWVYLSSLLTIALFFKFNRAWSLRNFDLLGLILLAPGLVLLDYGMNRKQPGYETAAYVWLFSVNGLMLVRMLLDTAMVRRPLLEPNLSVGGMVFLGGALLLFLLAKVLVVAPNSDNLLAKKNVPLQVTALKPQTEPAPMPTFPPSLNQQFQGQDDPGGKPVTPVIEPAAPAPAPLENPVRTAEQKQDERQRLSRLGPGYWLVRTLPTIATPIFAADEVGNKLTQEEARSLAATRSLLILAHLAVVLGMLWIGLQHFGKFSTGAAAALLYLLLPYTAMYIGWVQHALPAACLTWAIALYRRPLAAGVLIGLACGMIYYPVFLLPLWISFYWKRGLLRFIVGLTGMLLVLIGVTALYATGWDDFLTKLQIMTGFMFPTMEPAGFWGGLDESVRIYRITVLAAHIALAGSFALWPVQKNLGTLLSCSAAVMLSTQFWAAFDGGNAMAWFLPLVLLTIFRPNLEDRVAVAVLGDGWWSRQRLRVNPLTQAA